MPVNPVPSFIMNNTGHLHICLICQVEVALEITL